MECPRLGSTGFYHSRQIGVPTDLLRSISRSTTGKNWLFRLGTGIKSTPPTKKKYFRASLVINIIERINQLVFFRDGKLLAGSEAIGVCIENSLSEGDSDSIGERV